MSTTQHTLNDYTNNTQSTTTRLKHELPEFTDWRNHPNNPENTQ